MPKSKVLIAFHTRDGHTAKVAEAIRRTAEKTGAAVEVWDLRRPVPPLPPTGTDAVFLAAPVNAGRFPPAFVRFIRKNLPTLNSLPTHLVTVCLAARAPSADARRTAEGYADSLCVATGLTPASRHLCAGALPYTQYGPLKKFIMKTIATVGGLETDTRRDYEFTDWKTLEDFVHKSLRKPRPRR